MHIHFLPALEERPIDGSRPRPYIFVHIDTPRRVSPPPSDEAVAEFFAKHNALLAMLEEKGVRIFSIMVHVHSLEGLAPHSSCYLDSLCAFLHEHPFAVPPRTVQFPLMLTVSVPEGGGEETAVDRSHPLFVEATSKICKAFWQNASVRATGFLFVDVVTAPDRFLVDTLARGSLSDDDPIVTLRVWDHPDDRTMGPGRLEIRLAGANFVAAGAADVSALARRVLAVKRSEATILYFTISSSNVATSVAASLVDHRDHSYLGVRFVAGVCQGAATVKAQKESESTLDGTEPCLAVLQCSSVAYVVFERFSFSSRTVAAVQAIQRPASGANCAPIAILEFRGCSFFKECDVGTPESGFLGLCHLASAVSCRSTTHCLAITETPLSASDSTALTGMLVDPECSLHTLKLGGTTTGSEPFLESGFVTHFFQQLPSMITLANLTFLYVAPPFTFSAILDGVERNYSLRELDGLTFEAELDPESASGTYAGEIESYLAANARGRATVAKAVAYPSCPDLQNKAIEAIRLLADSDDTTSLYLCLQLFLPSL